MIHWNLVMSCSRKQAASAVEDRFLDCVSEVEVKRREDIKVIQMNETNFANQMPIEACGLGYFRIGRETIAGAIVTGPLGTTRWDGFCDEQVVLKLLDHIDVLIVGTGEEISQIPEAFRLSIEDAGTGIEIMNTPTASRSYNALLAAGRRVAAALLPT